MESCYRSFQFRVHRRNGSSSPHSACCPYAVEIAWECELPPPLPIAPGLADFGYCPWCRPGGGLCEGLSIVGSVPSPTGRKDIKSPWGVVRSRWPWRPMDSTKWGNAAFSRSLQSRSAASQTTNSAS